MTSPLTLRFPFTGRWVARNSPANTVPSHGTTLFGSSHAVDFVKVDERGRSARLAWRTALATERPDLFLGFGAPVLAPIAGTVEIAEDGEEDHLARRSLFAGVPYLMGQAARVRRGPRGVAGNHVVIAAAPHGPFVLLAHLQRGSVSVRVGEAVAAGQRVGACGNSGNSTEPHVHMQASDSIDWAHARGIPIAFSRSPGDAPWMPRNGESFVVA